MVDICCNVSVQYRHYEGHLAHFAGSIDVPFCASVRLVLEVLRRENDASGGGGAATRAQLGFSDSAMT
jgi:hypothetical protein